MDRKTIVIKKYENRRLYDTVGSRYVNLEEVAEMIRSGADVQVVDAATGEDLTRVVLTQIIVDDAKAPGSAFPVDMLREMVIASGRLSQESMVKYMRAMFDMYQNAYRSFTPPVNPFDYLQMMGGARPAAPVPEPPRVQAESPQQKEAESRVRELQRRVAELENMISRSPAPRATKKRKSGARRRGKAADAG